MMFPQNALSQPPLSSLLRQLEGADHRMVYAVGSIIHATNGALPSTHKLAIAEVKRRGWYFDEESYSLRGLELSPMYHLRRDQYSRNQAYPANVAQSQISFKFDSSGQIDVKQKVGNVTTIPQFFYNLGFKNVKFDWPLRFVYLGAYGRFSNKEQLLRCIKSALGLEEMIIDGSNVNLRLKVSIFKEMCLNGVKNADEGEFLSKDLSEIEFRKQTLTTLAGSMKSYAQFLVSEKWSLAALLSDGFSAPLQQEIRRRASRNAPSALNLLDRIMKSRNDQILVDTFGSGLSATFVEGKSGIEIKL